MYEQESALTDDLNQLTDDIEIFTGSGKISLSEKPWHLEQSAILTLRGRLPCGQGTPARPDR